MPVQHLATGVLLVRAEVPTETVLETLRELKEQEKWVSATSGVYADNVLVSTEDLTKNGVLTLPGSDPIEWRHESLWFRLSEIVNDEWSTPLRSFSPVGAARYPKGASVEEHQDTGPYNTSRLVTFILYLNEDFKGGEITFPKLGIEYKARSGDVLAFLSEHRHCVNPVTEGERFCLIWFGEV